MTNDRQYNEILAKTTEEFRKRYYPPFSPRKEVWHALPGVSKESFPSLFSPPASKQEASNMMTLQRGYQASARFISVINQLTDQLVNQFGK